MPDQKFTVHFYLCICALVRSTFECAPWKVIQKV
jgi:hypothetical protein